MSNKGKRVRSIKIPAEPLDADQPEFQWELGPNVIGFDGGNGKMLSYRLVDGKLQRAFIPNARRQVTGESLGRNVDGFSELDIQFADFMGLRWGFGEGIWEIPSRYPVETSSNNEMRYGSEIQVMFNLINLVSLGVPNESEIVLVTSAPPGIVKKVAKTVKGAYLGGESGMNDGWWSIKVGKKEYEYRFTNVIVLPEGAASYAAAAFDVNGNAVEIPNSQTGYDMISGNVWIGDAGNGTFDDYFIVRGNLSPESIMHATDRDGGINTHMIQPTRDYIISEFEKAGLDKPTLSDPQIDSWLIRWANGGFKENAADIVVSGRPMNLHAIWNIFRKRFAEWMIREKFEPAWRQGADAALLTGGGFVYTADYIKAQYPKRNIITPENMPHVPRIDYWEMNAYGTLPLAANVKKVRRKVAK